MFLFSACFCLLYLAAIFENDDDAEGKTTRETSTLSASPTYSDFSSTFVLINLAIMCLKVENIATSENFNKRRRLFPPNNIFF